VVRVDNRKSRSAGGDGEGDSNKHEDFFHGRILSVRQLGTYHMPAVRGIPKITRPFSDPR
jgi:hypothetical protein